VKLVEPAYATVGETSEMRTSQSEKVWANLLPGSGPCIFKTWEIGAENLWLTFSAQRMRIDKMYVKTVSRRDAEDAGEK